MPVFTQFGEVVILDWVSLAPYLVNGWTVESGGPNFEIRIVNTRCDFRGGLIPPTIVLGQQLVATLPLEYRPTVKYNFVCAMGLGGARMTLNTDGTLVYQGVTTGFSTVYMNDVFYWLA